jgi:hypothetical protein
MTDYPVTPSYSGRHAVDPAQVPYSPPPVTGPPPLGYGQPAQVQPEFFGPPLAYYQGPPAYTEHYAYPLPTVEPFRSPYDPHPSAWVAAPRSPRLIRPGFIVAAVIVAVVIAAGVATDRLAAGSSGHSTAAGANRTLSFPASFASFTLQNDQTDQQAATDLRAALSADAPAYADAYSHAQIGIYAPTPLSDRRLIVIGLSGADSPATQSELDSGAPDAVVDSIMLGARVPNATPVDAGALSGSMRCGTVTAAANPVAVCAWADRSTFALVVDATTTDLHTAAANTLALRDAAEH